jgi:hypothetical protein
MGLDQYLYRSEYLSDYNHDKGMNNPAFKAIEELFGYSACQESPHISVDICVAYWRKANAIHKWFCDLDGGKDECQKIYVTSKDLKNLRDICKEVFKDHSKAKDLLPTTSGFFFGSDSYDEWYFINLENTISILDPLIDMGGSYTYQASW